jgi:hypothetical protein
VFQIALFLAGPIGVGPGISCILGLMTHQEGLMSLGTQLAVPGSPVV